MLIREDRMNFNLQKKNECFVEMSDVIVDWVELKTLLYKT